MPKLLDNQYTVKSDTKTPVNQVLVGGVESHSPAASAGIKTQDRLVSLVTRSGKTESITSADTLPAQTKDLAGQVVTVNILRAGKPKSVQVAFRSQRDVAASLKTSNPHGYLGISPTDYTLRRSTWSAPVVAGGLMGQITVVTFQGLWHVINSVWQGHPSQAGSQVSGPVGIVEILKNGSLLGYQFILLIVAIISLTLAIMNVLPIPALDGGRLFVTYLYRGLHKKLTQKAEERIHGTGFVVLMILVVLITIVDVKRLHGG
jgi:regulator of sigma E protease